MKTLDDRFGVDHRALRTVVALVAVLAVGLFINRQGADRAEPVAAVTNPTTSTTAAPVPEAPVVIRPGSLAAIADAHNVSCRSAVFIHLNKVVANNGRDRVYEDKLGGTAELTADGTAVVYLVDWLGQEHCDSLISADLETLGFTPAAINAFWIDERPSVQTSADGIYRATHDLQPGTADLLITVEQLDG